MRIIQDGLSKNTGQKCYFGPFAGTTNGISMMVTTPTYLVVIIFSDDFIYTITDYYKYFDTYPSNKK